jgi:hypothetical protein
MRRDGKKCGREERRKKDKRREWSIGDDRSEEKKRVE